MKRLFSIILVIALAVSLSAAALAASAKATTMRLARTEGTVTLKNSAGTALSISEGMKLYNKYKLATSQKSYAYVSLDDSKAVKLDASSEAEVKKSGRRLELLLRSGELFFNITVPLESDESLNIRTSTTVTGIRGTSGVVNQVDASTSEIMLYTGSVTLSPNKAGQAATELHAGQLMRVTNPSGAIGGGETQMEVRDLTEQDIPGFAALEIAESPELQKRMKEQTKLDVQSITENADRRLKEDEAKKDEKAEGLKPNPWKAPDHMFDAPQPVYHPSSVTLNIERDFASVVEAVEGAPTHIDSEEKLTNALNAYDIVYITGTVDANSLLSVPSITVPYGKQLYIQSGSITAGGITVDGTLEVSNGAELTNTGDFSLSEYGRMINSGSFTNEGEEVDFSGGAFINTGTLTDESKKLYVTDANNKLIYWGDETYLFDDHEVRTWTDGEKVTLASSVESTSTVRPIDRAVTLNLGNKLMTGGTVLVANTGSLTVSGGSDGTLSRTTGGEVPAPASPAVTVATGGTLTLQSGVISGGIDNGGTFNFYGGSLVVFNTGVLAGVGTVDWGADACGFLLTDDTSAVSQTLTRITNLDSTLTELDGDGVTYIVKLIKNVTLASTMTVSEGVGLTIDGHGANRTVDYTGAGAAITVNETGNLTMNNIDLRCTGGGRGLFADSGSSVNISNGSISSTGGYAYSSIGELTEVFSNVTLIASAQNAVKIINNEPVTEGVKQNGDVWQLVINPREP